MTAKHPPQANGGPVGRLLTNTFGHPCDILGRVGGFLIAGSNRTAAAWLIDLLAIQPDDTVLEIGFGPGVAIERLSQIKEHHSLADHSD